jgi:PiT family inorganic phosphate transporter
MADTLERARKDTLDKDLDKLVHVEEAANVVARGLVGPGLGLLFLALTAVATAFWFSGEPGVITIVAAAAVGAYMAMNIGANDVANNVGPAVGAKVLTMGGALAIAGVFEASGALIAGGDVVDTISRGIIAPEAVSDPSAFVQLMLAALLSSAIWVHLATWLGAPVSTTHSIVGGVLGSGVAAAGFAAVDWSVMGAIAASWVISPVLGGVIAAAFLAFIKAAIIYQDDKLAAARRWVPLLIAVMAGAFAAYLATKGLGRLVKLDGFSVIFLGAAAFVIAWGLSRSHVIQLSRGLENRNQSLRKLFALPLVISAALLSFAHGANDVANAVGPLAAIVATTTGGQVDAQVGIPLWVMLIGASGIVLGLLLFGPRLIRMVGEQITRLNPMRAFCVALSAALTVIVASWFGMPVSSTHIAVGAVFGVGFFREWYTANSKRRRAYLERKMNRDRARRAASGAVSTRASDDEQDAEAEGDGVPLSREEVNRRRLVRRAHVTTIVAAWITTVPAAAALSAGIYGLLRAFT